MTAHEGDSDNGLARMVQLASSPGYRRRLAGAEGQEAGGWVAPSEDSCWCATGSGSVCLIRQTAFCKPAWWNRLESYRMSFGSCQLTIPNSARRTRPTTGAPRPAARAFGLRCGVLRCQFSVVNRGESRRQSHGCHVDTETARDTLTLCDVRSRQSADTEHDW